MMEPIEYLLKRSLLSRNKHAIIVNLPDGNKCMTCVVCSQNFFDIEELQTHIYIEHNKEYRHICDICGTGLKRKEHLDRHRGEHNQVRPYPCTVCGKSFKRKEHLTIHNYIHTGERKQDCPICRKAFHRKDHLQKHVYTHSKMLTEGELDQMEDIKPDLNSFIVPNDLEEVKKLVGIVLKSDDPERPFACAVCNKTFKRKDHLRLHGNTHLNKTKKCSVCGKGFMKDVQLLQHMNTHVEITHPDQLETDVLEVKQELIAEEHYENPSPSSSSENIKPSPESPSKAKGRSKKDPNARPYECDVCHKRFKRRQHLKVHFTVHTKRPKNVWCSMCHEGFENNDQFESHGCILDHIPKGMADKIKEKQNGNKKSEFNEADLQMKVKELIESELLPSITVMTEENGVRVPQKLFVCKFCSKPFRRKDHYKIHLNIHTGIRSFFCPECGKGFYRKDHLQKHLQTHEKKMKKKSIPDLLPISLIQNAKLFPQLSFLGMGSSASALKALQQATEIKIKQEITDHNDSQTYEHTQRMEQDKDDNSDVYNMHENVSVEYNNCEENDRMEHDCDDIEQDCDDVEQDCDDVDQDCGDFEEDCDDIEEDCDDIEQDCDDIEQDSDGDGEYMMHEQVCVEYNSQNKEYQQGSVDNLKGTECQMQKVS